MAASDYCCKALHLSPLRGSWTSLLNAFRYSAVVASKNPEKIKIKCTIAESYSKPSQTSNTDLFAKIVNSLKPFTIFGKTPS